MIKERKYNNNNLANAKCHIPLIKIREAIKYYIKSQPNLTKYYDFSYESQEHDLDLILDECIERVKYGKTYRSSKFIPKSTFHKHFQLLHKRKILKNTYIELLKEYFKKGANRKLLYRYKDTTCIVNKNGKENVEYNGYKKRKVSKVSLESDSNGVVIHSTINGGNEHDAKIFLRDIHVKYFIDNNLIKYLSKYYSADPAYYTNKILKYLKSKDLIPIIKPNIKNTKDKAKLKKLKLNTYQNKIYGKRFKIEDTNSNIKSFKLVQTRMDCSNNSFESSLFISYINKVQRYL